MSLIDNEIERGHSVLNSNGRERGKRRENAGPRYDSLLWDIVPKKDLNNVFSLIICVGEREVIVRRYMSLGRIKELKRYTFCVWVGFFDLMIFEMMVTFSILDRRGSVAIPTSIPIYVEEVDRVEIREAGLGSRGEVDEEKERLKFGLFFEIILVWRCITLAGIVRICLLCGV